MIKSKHVFLFVSLMLAFGTLTLKAARADQPQITSVQATMGEDNLWRFDVTVRHGDEGWDHYADRWEIVDSDGKVLATRVLAHPHENEQPFTRSLGKVAIPPQTKSITLRAHDKVHGLGPAVTLDLATGAITKP